MVGSPFLVAFLEPDCYHANVFTILVWIDGLWPDYNDGTWPACCTRSDFNEKEVSFSCSSICFI